MGANSSNGFVSLKNYEDKDVTIDTITKALDGLHDLGCACDYAYLVKGIAGGGLASVLVYDGSFYFPPVRDYYERPKSHQRLKELLDKMFDPFLCKDYPARSLIDVCNLRKGDRRKRGTNKKIFGLTMLLYLNREYTSEAADALAKRSDSTSKIRGLEFCLD